MLQLIRRKAAWKAMTKCDTSGSIQRWQLDQTGAELDAHPTRLAGTAVLHTGNDVACR
jgi:hypothetical protein